MLLLHQLAVGSGVAGGTEAGVALSVVPIDARPAVCVGIVETLVTILTSLPVRSDSLSAGTPITAPAVSSVSGMEVVYCC